MASRLPTASQIDAVLEFLPQLEAPNQRFAQPGDSPITVWNAPLVDALMVSLSRNGFVLRAFDWPGWDEGRQHAEDLDWIGRADLLTLCKLFTAHVRNERFCSGHFASMCEGGYIQAMLRRLAVLRKIAPDKPGSSPRGQDPMAKQVPYWDYDRDAVLTCPDCGWTGRGTDNQKFFRELLDVKCLQCDRMLLIVSYPTSEETRAAAAAGNERASAELPALEWRDARQERAETLELKDPSQLPDLEGAAVRIDWDLEERSGESWTILRHDGREIWRELAFWEGYERFAEVFEILRRRYGTRLAEVRPTQASALYLYGDSLTASGKVTKLNASLGQ